jgi:hypothetical protein
LHSDDITVLEYIKNTLQIGKVRSYPKISRAIFEVSVQRDISIILTIFNKYNLNTNKYLDFMDFEKVF